MLFGVHSVHFFTVVLEPLLAGATRELFEIYCFDEAAVGDACADLRATNSRQWLMDFEEGRSVVEGM